MKPGETMSPTQSMTSASFPVLASATATAFRCLGQLRLPAREQVEHRHANRHAIRNLFQNHAVWTIGHIGVDFDAAIHRARVQDQDVTRCAIESLARDSEDAVVFSRRRYIARGHSLELETQDVQRLGPLDRFLDPIEDANSEFIDRIRKQRAWSAD